jgi:predicted XRE-type DNA-binding protein
MVKVCVKEFPETEGFYLDGYLKENLDILAESITKDFDFVILISGSGMTRVGKSLIGMQVGYYLNSRVNELNKLHNTFTTDNYSFKGEELIKMSKEFPQYSVVCFDECGSDLMARKTMHSTTQALLDYLRECGQKNQFLICILPDFFDLPKGIALTRSVCLIDVQFVEKFNRGNFKFYGRRAKKMLYLKGKKFLDYDAHRPDFHGAFTNFYTVDEAKYRQMKLDALHGREKDAAQKVSERMTRTQIRLTNQKRELVIWLKEQGISQADIARRLGVTSADISILLSGDKHDA